MFVTAKLENQPSSLHKIIAVILLRNRRIYIDTDHYSLNRRSSKNKGRLRTISDGLLKQSTSIFNDDEETEEETVQCCLLFVCCLFSSYLIKYRYIPKL